MNKTRNYIFHGSLLENMNSTQKLRHQSTSYTMEKDKLYKRSTIRDLLKCITSKEAKLILVEIHEGSHVNNFWGKSLAQFIGYYCPNLHQEVEAYAKGYQQCQKFASIIYQSFENLTTLAFLGSSYNVVST